MSLPSSGFRELLLCYYCNASSQLQVIRVFDTSSCHLKRIVFPGDRLMFEAELGNCLEIYTATSSGMKFERKILCRTLQIKTEIVELLS